MLQRGLIDLRYELRIEDGKGAEVVTELDFEDAKTLYARLIDTPVDELYNANEGFSFSGSVRVGAVPVKTPFYCSINPVRENA